LTSSLTRNRDSRSGALCAQEKEEFTASPTPAAAIEPLNMDSQDPAPTDRREGNTPANNEEAAKVPAETANTKAGETETKPNDRPDTTKKGAKEKTTKKHSKSKHKKTKKRAPVEEDTDDTASDDDVHSSQTSSDSDSTDSDSEAENTKKHRRSARKRAEATKAKKKAKAKKAKKVTKPQTPASDTSDSDSSDPDTSDVDDDDESHPNQQQQDLAQLLQMQQLQMQQMQRANSFPYGGSAGLGGTNSLGLDPRFMQHVRPPKPRGRSRQARRNLSLGGLDGNLLLDGKRHAKQKQKKKAAKLDYKRVDQVWDNNLHNYKLQDTAEATLDAEYEESLFHVRRTFDWEGKYKQTVVDVKSKLLRECLQDIMGNIKGVSLVEETPRLDPNMLFLYVDRPDCAMVGPSC
jgi:hypothetical protein